MIRNKFGLKDEYISIIGFGGMVIARVEEKEAYQYIGEAIDNGINYFDVAPSYGRSEEYVGMALKDKREKIFLASKTHQRTHGGLIAEIGASLRLLKTDYLELYQLHGIRTIAEAKAVLARGGAVEAMEKLKTKGIIKYIGFSAHSEGAAIYLLQEYAFDSVMYPVNIALYINSGNGQKVLEMAKKRKAAVIAIKALAKGNWPPGTRKAERRYPGCWYEPIDEEELAETALRFIISQGITSIIPPGHIKLQRLVIDIMKNIKGGEQVEIDKVKRVCKDMRLVMN